MASCGGDTLANSLMTKLLAGVDFTIPVIDTSGPGYELPDFSDIVPLTPLKNEDLTTRHPKGSGTFDALMESISMHLKEEFTSNRISGAEYTKAYTAMVANALATASQFLLGRDQSHWQAVLAQAQAQTAQVNLITAKVQMQIARTQLAQVQLEAKTAEATYALTKMKIATEDQTFCQLKAQTDLINEQKEVQRSQTLDTRSDGATVKGTVGKQKDLYSQQVVSYQRDAEVKAGKLFLDGWITQRTTDEQLPPPANLSEANIDKALSKIRTANGFV